MLGKKRKVIKRAIRTLLVLGVVLVTLCGIKGVQAHAEGEAPDTVTSATPTEKRFKYVRVGYYYSELFQEGMTDLEPKSGYGYEYMQKIADYNGWEYLYVYGTWSDLLAKLENGEIDVLCGVSMTDEREGKMLFPNYEMGMDRYVIYQREEDKIMDASDMSTFDRTTIGGIKDNLMTYYLEEWIKENKLDVTIKYYDGFEERDADFRDKKLDGIVATDSNILAESGYTPVVTVGEQPYYMAITNCRKDLLREMNTALATMQELEPYFMQTLQSDNYGMTVTNSRLTSIEQAWLDGHDTLEVGYLSNYMPYCGVTTAGEATGLMTDVFDAMLTQLNLKGRLQVNYHPYDSYQALVDALQKEEVDAIFPVGGGVWNMEQDGIDSTSAVVTSGMNFVYNGTYGEDKFQSIAVSRGNKILYYYVTANYPDAQIIYCDSVEECLDKVLFGEAGGTMVNGLRSEIVNANERYEAFSLLQLEKSDTRSIGVRDGNYSLLLLLNRGVRIIGRDYGINASYNYVDELYSKSAMEMVKDFVRHHILATLVLAILLIVIIAFCIANYAIKNRERMLLREQAYTDGLTKLNNRFAYEEELVKLEKDGIPENFVYQSIDINGLKQVNDSLGHAAGDELIIGAATILKEVYGKHAKIYRTGGDEYIVMFKASDRELELYDTKMQEVANHWKGDMCDEIHLAIGCAKRKDYKEANIHELAKIADDEMYVNKDAFYAANGLPRR